MLMDVVSLSLGLETGGREKSNAPDDLQKLRDEIERVTMPLAAVLMDAVAKSAMAGKALDEL